MTLQDVAEEAEHELKTECSNEHLHQIPNLRGPDPVLSAETLKPKEDRLPVSWCFSTFS